MKGIILAGGNGRRLEPITIVTNKHLLAVYDRPMIYYPLQTLIDAGIRDIMIVSGKDHAGGFLKLLGSGKSFNCKFQYEVQEEAGGIAQALSLAESFVGDDNCAVILGDNIFADNFATDVKEFEDNHNLKARHGQSHGAKIFLKKVEDASRFGVATLQGDRVLEIEEKPKFPKTDLAVTGLYIYNNNVFKIIKTLRPSARGELEITDVNNIYIKKGLMKARIITGEWTDAGTFESLFRANVIARRLVQGQK